jgi:hypothetical protein
MTDPKNPYTGRNRLLAALSAGDFALLAPYLVREELPLRRRLETPNRAIGHVAFVEYGMASVVLKVGQKTGEIGVVGHEGMTGLPVVLHAEHGPTKPSCSLREAAR